MATFDPNAAAGETSGVFGLPYGEEESALVIVPVPWEATTSYGGGAAQGPAAILAASRQVDLFDLDVLRPYEPGLFMRPIPEDLLALNDRAKALAQRVIAVGGAIGPHEVPLTQPMGASTGGGHPSGLPAPSAVSGRRSSPRPRSPGRPRLPPPPPTVRRVWPPGAPRWPTPHTRSRRH